MTSSSNTREHLPTAQNAPNACENGMVVLYFLLSFQNTIIFCFLFMLVAFMNTIESVINSARRMRSTHTHHHHIAMRPSEFRYIVPVFVVVPFMFRKRVTETITLFTVGFGLVIRIHTQFAVDFSKYYKQAHGPKQRSRPDCSIHSFCSSFRLYVSK